MPPEGLCWIVASALSKCVARRCARLDDDRHHRKGLPLELFQGCISLVLLDEDARCSRTDSIGLAALASKGEERQRDVLDPEAAVHDIEVEEAHEPVPGEDHVAPVVIAVDPSRGEGVERRTRPRMP